MKHLRLFILFPGSVKISAVALVPEPHHQEPEQSASQVRKMRHVVPRVVLKTHPQFHSNVTDDKPLGFDRHKKVQVNEAVGKQHAKGHQQAKDGTRSTQRGLIQETENSRAVGIKLVKLQSCQVADGCCIRQVLELECLHRKKAKRCAQPANKVKDQEAFRPPDIFQDAAEHPQGKHIEKDVLNGPMHEQVRNELVRMKKFRLPVMQGKKYFELVVKNTFADPLREKYKDIDDNKILYDRWQDLESAGSEF